MFFLLFFREQEIKLEEGEIFLHDAKRHWMVLLQRMLLPGLLFLFVLSVLIFRLVGGRLFETTAVRRAGYFDTISLLVIVALVGIVGAYLRSRRVSPKNRVGGVNLLFCGFVLFLYLFYRLSGGEVVVFSGSSSGMDTLNWTLLIILLALGTFIDFTVYDWRSDDLILTNRRVLYEDYVPIFRDFRLQTQIEDVQSVTAKSDSYLQNLLGYGTLIVQSAGQTPIIFTGCNDFEATRDSVTGYRKRVSVMQRKIQEQVDKYKKERNPREWGTLVQKQIYGNAPPLQPPPVSAPRGGQGNWLFPHNPEIRNDKDRTIIWRKHSIFELLMLLPPTALGIAIVAGLGFANRYTLISLGSLFWLSVLALVVIGAFAWYQVEDHRNDLYILTLNSIIDVEKKPFGPENRRQAGLGQIQNVNYQTSWIGNFLGYAGLGYGDVFIETASNLGRFTFHHVPNPRDVSTTINDYLNTFRQGDRERSLRESLELLKAYHQAEEDRAQNNP